MLKKLMPMLLGTGMTMVATAAGTAVVTLDSPSNGQTVAPGATIEWSILVEVSSDDNLGLALFSADLTQDATNPVQIDIPPADASSIPDVMNGFDRPGGITNPGENGGASGYIGVQRGTAGAKNLLQIGGGQNTFGKAGSDFAKDPNVDGGIAHGAAQLIASGTLKAPASTGTYNFRLKNVAANVLLTIKSPPDFSTVDTARVDVNAASFSFTVSEETACGGDANCDGEVTFNDIDYFVAALISENDWKNLFGGDPSCDYKNNDANFDGSVDFNDIDPFVQGLIDGGCIPPP